MSITKTAPAVTQYTEDQASAADPIGVQQLARRRDTPASETTTDGDVTALNSTAKGELYVKHIDSVPITASSLPLPTGAATSANQATEIASLASIDSKLTSPLTVQATNLDIRDLVFATDKVDASGTTLGANSGVDIGDVDVTSVIPGIGATNLGKAVDSVAGATDVGVAALSVRDDALTTLTPIDGDYVHNRTNARGAIWTSIEDGSGGQVTDFTGVEYTEGDTDVSFTGKIALGEAPGNEARPIQLNSSFNLKTNIENGSGAGAVNIQDGGNSITVDGTVDTELPVAAALADNTTNPTTTSVGTFPHWYDGTTWDRAKGDSTDGLLTNLGANNDIRVYDAAGTGLTSTLNSGKQSLDVNITGGASTSSVTDQNSFTYGVSSETPVGGVFQDTTPTLTAGQTGAVRLTAERAFHTNLRNNAGTEVGTAGAPLRVDPTGSTTQPVSATNLDIRDLVFASDKVDASGTTLGANSGVDIGDVTINNAAGASAVNIQDGGNSITVDGTVGISGTVTVSATNLDIRDIDAATDDITVHGDVGVLDQFDLTNSNPLTVALVDSNGDQITSLAGAEYTEDVASPADPSGKALQGRRRDTPASETTTDGDWTTLNCTSKGELYVKHLDSFSVAVTSLPNEGQQTMANSISVAIASDQSNVPVDVKGASAIVAITPTISTSAYAAEDQIGGLQTITSAVRTSGGTAVLHSITITDKAKQLSDLDIYFFDSSPTIASSDNAAIDISDSEMASKCIGIVKVKGSDYSSLLNNSVVSMRNVGLTLDATGSTSIFAVAKIGNAATYVSTSDLVFKYHFLQD